MAQTSFMLLASVFLLLLVVLAEGGPPKPMKVKCQDKMFTSCYHKDLFCPDSCPRTCVADCDSCQPICVPPPLPPPKPRTPKKVKCQDKKFSSCYYKNLFCPATCPRTCVVDCESCQPVCVPPPLPPPKPRSPKKVKCQDKKFPRCYHKSFACPVNCPRTCIADCDSCQPVCLPLSPPLPPTPPASTPNSPPPLSPPLLPPTPPSTPSSPPPLSPPLPPTPPSTPNSPPPPDQAAGGKRVSCKNKLYSQCYRQEYQCPSACPDTCEVDCVTCSPVCNCNRPGAVCQDPRFVGADGLTFYFHGKKDDDFCLVTDSNLHINAHFIGRRNENMKRDFTWVQSLGILFNNHKLFIGAKKTSTWNDALDRLDLAFDGQSIILPNREGAKWEPNSSTSITRNRDTNSVVIEVEGNFQIKARVVPITEKDSRIHNYGITEDDCFAHLDLSFKFYSLSGKVNGVLGQTYGNNYVSRVKMGIEMPVLGGEKEFSSSGIFSTDCAVSRFTTQLDGSKEEFVDQYADLKCASSMDGKGVVCKR